MVRNAPFHTVSDIKQSITRIDVICKKEMFLNRARESGGHEDQFPVRDLAEIIKTGTPEILKKSEKNPD